TSFFVFLISIFDPAQKGRNIGCTVPRTRSNCNSGFAKAFSLHLYWSVVYHSANRFAKGQHAVTKHSALKVVLALFTAAAAAGQGNQSANEMLWEAARAGDTT